MTDPRLLDLQEALEGLDISLTTLRVAIRRFRSRPANSTLGLMRTHRGRGKGIAIIPGSVKQARLQAGLSLAEVAGREITRVAVWYVEKGKTRPSMETLLLIAQRTGKPVEFFLASETCAACGVAHAGPCLDRADLTSEELITRRA